MDALLDDDDLEFDKLDESDHSFKRKRPTEASWDSDDELLQEDHIPVKKTKILSDDDLDEDALLGDSDNEDFSTYDAAAEDQGAGDLAEDSALVDAANVETNNKTYEYGVDDQTGGQTVEQIGDLQEDYVGHDDGDYAEQLDDQIEEYQGEDDDQTGDQTGVETGEISVEYSGMLGNTESEEWGGREDDVGGDYVEEEGEEEYHEEGGENFEEGGDNFEEGYNEDAVAEDEEAVATADEDAGILEDAIELEPGMDDILDIEDLDDSLIEDDPEDNTTSGRAAKLTPSTPKAPVREKTAQVEEASKPKEQPSSQPVHHAEEKEEEEGSDTKEDIPSSDSDEDDDDDNTRARFKSERQPVAVKVGGVSKRKDIPETLEITAQVQQTLDDYARQNEEQQWTKRNRGRGGRGFRGNRGNRHQGPPPMMGMHPGNMGPRFPGHMGPRFPGDMRHRFPGDMRHRFPGDMRHRFPGDGPHHFHDNRPHYMEGMPPRPAFQQLEVIRGPPAGHLRGGRFDFEPYHPGKASPNRVPQQDSGQEPPGLNQGGQRSSSPHTQAPPVQQSGQPGAVTTSQPQSSVSKKIHINPHFKGQVQVPSHQVVTPQTAHPPAHSTAPTHSQYQPPSTHYQPPASYPNQYPAQPYSQHGTAPGHPPQPMQTQPSSHPQGPPPLMEQQHPASYGDPNRRHGDQQSGHWMPPSSQHPSSGAWTQPARPSLVSVTWSHQQGQPRQEFQGHQPHQHPPQFNRAQTPQERIPPHQQFQSPRGMQPNQMCPDSEPQHQGAPQPRHQGPTYHGQGPQSARQGAGQRFPAPNNQQPGQFTSQQHRPQGSGVQPSTPNQADKGKILPSPKRLIEEASKKAPKVAAVKGEIDEDAETRKLRLQLGEQKKLREMILQRKEARRQQLAASKQAELKKRLSAKKAKTSAETSDTRKSNREQQPPAHQQQQQQQPTPSQGARMPAPRHSTQQPPNQAGNRAIPPASSNRNNSTQSQQNLPRQAPPQQWSGGPGQPRPMSQPRAPMVRHEASPLVRPGPPRQLFQQQTWQQQQNVKVLVDMAPQPIPTVGAGGRVQPIGVVGAANRAPSGPVRGQQQGQIRGQQPGQIRGQQPGQIRGQQPGQIRGQQPGQIRGQQPGQIRGQQPGQIRGQQPGQIRGQQPGQIRGRQPGQHPGQIRGQQQNQMRGPHPGQIRGQHPSQVRGQQPRGPPNSMGRGRGRGQPRQRFPVPRHGQPQGNGPQTQGPRPHGQGGPQFRGPRPQGMAPRPQGPGGAGTPQGGPRPQKRSVKDRIGIPQQGPAQTQQAPEQVQRRVVQQQSPQQAPKTTPNQGAGNQPGQTGNKRTVVQNLTPQQRLLQQKQQQRLAQRPQGVNQPVWVLPPQPQRVVKQVSAEGPRVVRGPLGILIDGLSASTDKKNLMKMLQSCGPVKNMEIVASERRAYAKFCRPEDAMSFQTKFHRHMIDLATINVTLIPD